MMMVLVLQPEVDNPLVWRACDWIISVCSRRDLLSFCGAVQAGGRSRRCQRCDESQVLHLNQLAGCD